LRFCVTADIFEDVEKKVSGTGVKVWCVGGGRILHTAQQKKLNVFGYSQVRLSLI
jgi:Janus/Ocnus family (Ocnus)